MTKRSTWKIDWSRLLGFEQLSDKAPGERIGAKVGDKGKLPASGMSTRPEN